MIPHPKLSSLFTIAFSTVTDGNMLRIDKKREEVDSNRRTFLHRYGMNYEASYRVRTSHSCNLEIVEKYGDKLVINRYCKTPLISADYDYYHQGADGAFSMNSRLPIFLISGDCVPLIVWDECSGFHGVVHVGMLGAINNIVGGISKIVECLEINITTIKFYIGPYIKKENYNISDSGLWKVIRDQTIECFPEIFKFIHMVGVDEYFDLEGVVRNQLLSIGAFAENISSYDICTTNDESKFYSHYKTRGSSERQQFISLIGAQF